MNSVLQPNIKVIDFNILRCSVADKAGQIEILRSFHTESRSDIADLCAALTQANADAVAKTAHRMKGVSRMVGAHEMHEICYKIETAAKLNDLATAIRSHELLEDAMLRIEAIVERFIRD